VTANFVTDGWLAMTFAITALVISLLAAARYL
jgi:hypothetical protein